MGPARALILHLSYEKMEIGEKIFHACNCSWVDEVGLVGHLYS